MESREHQVRVKGEERERTRGPRREPERAAPTASAAPAAPEAASDADDADDLPRARFRPKR